MTITEFLLARMAEDEAELSDGRSHWMHGDDAIYRRDMHLRFNPDDMVVNVGYGRALADIEAKRRVIELYAEHDHSATADHKWTGFEGGYATATDHVLSALALPYADHPDYREEWRPS